MQRKAIIVHDCLFGDAGKGAAVDYLAHQYDNSLVIRYAGGPQCGHNVTAQGKHHCFSSFGSGGLSGKHTIIDKGVLVNPLLVIHEEQVLGATLGVRAVPQLLVHRECLVITPFHMAANRIEERKLQHGSCGSGIWKTMEYAEKYPDSALRIQDIERNSQEWLLQRLQEIKARLFENFQEEDFFDDEWIKFVISDDMEGLGRIYQSFVRNYEIVGAEDLSKLTKDKYLIFEGNQGALLDQNIGFFPHVSGDCSYQNALDFLRRIDFQDQVIKLGVIRPYSTRHGNGPLPQGENATDLPGERNMLNAWQGHFRMAPLNLTLLNYSLFSMPVDKLAISCLDHNPYDYYIKAQSPVFHKTPEELTSAHWRKDAFHSQPGSNRAMEIGHRLSVPLAGTGSGPDRANRFIAL